MVSTCKMFGISRQVYYRAKKREKDKEDIATQIIENVYEVEWCHPSQGNIWHEVGKMIIGNNLKGTIQYEGEGLIGFKGELVKGFNRSSF